MSLERPCSFRMTLADRLSVSDGRRRALVIGIQEYDDHRLDIRHARADAQAIRELLRDPDCGLFSEVELLLDGAATKRAIEEALSNLGRSTPGDTIWIYFAGQAALEGNAAYLIPHDGVVAELSSTGISVQTISHTLQESRSDRVIAILDCRYAESPEPQNGGGRRKTFSPPEVPAELHGNGRAVIYGPPGWHEAGEPADAANSVFTSAVLHGLCGEADLDGDGIVGLGEFWEYLGWRAREDASRPCHPQEPCWDCRLDPSLGLTLNRPRIQETGALEAVVRGMMNPGRREGGLTSEQTRLCLRIVRAGGRTERGQQIEVTLRDLVAGQMSRDAAVTIVQGAGDAGVLAPSAVGPDAGATTPVSPVASPDSNLPETRAASAPPAPWYYRHPDHLAWLLVVAHFL